MKLLTKPLLIIAVPLALFLTTGQLLAVSPIGSSDELGLPTTKADSSTLNNILGKVYFVAGFLAVVMIIVGGFKYIFAGGNPEKAKQGWLTMLYAFIGLIVTLAAFAITRFVINKIPISP